MNYTFDTDPRHKVTKYKLFKKKRKKLIKNELRFVQYNINSVEILWFYQTNVFIVENVENQKESIFPYLF